jgi:hypothetical protein
MSQAVTAEDIESGFVERLAIPRSYLLLTVLFGVVFLYYSYIPLFHSDIWGHVIYGEWILENGQLPNVDPYLKLADGVPVTCTAWLGQVIFGAAFRADGAEAVSVIFGVANLATWLILTVACYLRSRSLWSAVAAAFFCWIASWSRHAVVRPEIFGSLCFAALLLVVTLRAQSSSETSKLASTGRNVLFNFGVGLIFALWANLHGSFIVGFGILGCQLLGRAIDTGVQSRSLMSILRDRDCWRWLVTCEVALLATLANPYGIDLLIHTLVFPSNPNLKDVLEWFSLEMVSYEGIEIGFSWIVLAILLRFSRVSFRPADVLMLSIFCFATVLRVRMQNWYAPVFAVVLAPHIADVASRVGLRFQSDETRSPLNARLALFVIWVCFAVSPVSRPLLGGDERPADKLFGQATPVKLTQFLRSHSPGGQVLNPQWWGDWLAAFGPGDIEMFMTTNAVHIAPQRLWQDYMSLARGSQPFEETLDRYRVNTIIVHKELQVQLERKTRRLAGWKIVYEDDLGLVAMREAVADRIKKESSTTDSGSRLPASWMNTVDASDAAKEMVQR